jgi:hypothetical protein
MTHRINILIKTDIVWGKNEFIEITSMLQKPRVPQVRGGRGEAVLGYCEPLDNKGDVVSLGFPEG